MVSVGQALSHCLSGLAVACRFSVSRLKPEDRTLEMGVIVVVRDLGVCLLDSELTMKRYVSKTVCTCFYHLRRLRQL